MTAYDDEAFQESAATARELVDAAGAAATDRDREAMVEAFTIATRYELMFWADALDTQSLARVVRLGHRLASLARRSGRAGHRARVRERSRLGRHHPVRPRLDSEHQPHRALRGHSGRTVRRGRTRRRDPAVQQHHAGPAGRRRGNAEFGISTHSQATFSRAAGSDTVTVLAPLQHRATAIGVRADRTDLQSPRDLDGLTYAGFGDPGDNETLSQVIRNDGGTGEFTSVVLGTSAYEAVYSGTADFTVSYVAWEGLEARTPRPADAVLRAHRLRVPRRLLDRGRRQRDLDVGTSRQCPGVRPGPAAGVPDSRGRSASAERRHLIDANPGLFTDESLVFESQQMLSADYMRDDSGQVGTLDLERWSGYSRFLFEAGLLAGADGATLTEEPDWSAYFTDAYLVH